MKHWTIRQRILWSFGLTLALMLGMGGTALYYTEHMLEDVSGAEQASLPGIAISGQLVENVLDHQVNAALHIHSEDKEEMHRLAADIAREQEEIADAARRYEPTILTAYDRARFDSVKAALAEYLREHDRVLELSTALQNRAAAELWASSLEPRYQKLRSELKALVDLNRGEGAASLQAVRDSALHSRNTLAAILLAAVTLAALAGQALFRAVSEPLARLISALDLLRQGDFTGRLRLERSDEFGAMSDGFDRMADELTALVGQVQKSGLQVTTSVTEVSATAKQQQATAKEIAATTAEIGATSQEISATSQELVRTMDEVSSGAERAAALASSGQSGLTQMEETMQQVMEGSTSITAKLSVLSEKASNINQVIVTITKVADQTNLLSLNAAIEAEKAGDQGRGFSVVATEIRRLADQTAVATYDIEQTVKEIQSAISASVMGMDKFSEQLRRGVHETQQIGAQLSEIISHVQDLAPRFETVGEGMRAQATGAEQIKEALSQLNDAAQQTAESLRESNQAIEDLHQVANGLRVGVSRFRVAAG